MIDWRRWDRELARHGITNGDVARAAHVAPITISPARHGRTRLRDSQGKPEIVKFVAGMLNRGTQLSMAEQVLDTVNAYQSAVERSLQRSPDGGLDLFTLFEVAPAIVGRESEDHGYDLGHRSALSTTDSDRFD